MATLGLKEMGKFWVHVENEKKNWYSILELDAMPLSLKNLLLKFEPKLLQF